MPREITIYPVANGFVVKGGCQMFAYENKERLKADLCQWVENPQAKEQEIVSALKLPTEVPCPNIVGGCACEAPMSPPSSDLERELRR